MSKGHRSPPIDLQKYIIHDPGREEKLILPIRRLGRPCSTEVLLYIALYIAILIALVSETTHQRMYH